MRIRAVLQIAGTTFREFIRTPEAVFWTYGFPIIMALGLGFAFSSESAAPIRAVVVEGVAAAALAEDLREGSEQRIEVVLRDEAAARRGLALGDYDVLVGGDANAPIIDVDLTRSESELAVFWIERALGRAAGRDVEPVATIRPVEEKGARYIDFLIPGLIGLNLLGAGMYGVGFNLVQLRVRQMLRRLHATPMSSAEFLVSFVVSRLILVVPEGFFVMLFGAWVFDVPMRGSTVLLVLILLAGGAAFSGLGLLVASRTRSVEAVSGWINLITLPMWLLGGSFFSNDRFPELLQPVVAVLPLTHLNDALREVMLGGAGLEAVWGQLTILLGFALASLVLASRVFRWG